MQVNQYPNQATEMTVLDRFGFDQQDTITGDWLTKKYDLPTFVDSIVDLFPNLTENIYNTDGSLPTGATRTFDLDTGKINLLDGNMNIGGTGIVGGTFRIEVTGSPSGIIVFSTGTAGQFSGDIAAMQLFSGAIGLFSAAQRNIMRDDATVIPAADPSCILELISTSKGLLISRMTEAERDIIASPSPYLEVMNTTKGMRDFYHPVFGWISSPISLGMACSTTSTVTSSTYYFSMASGLALRATIGGLAIRPTRKGKILRASFTRFISSTLGDRSYSLYIRINNTTDYLIATQGTTAVETFFENSALNTTGIPVDVTDSIVMKLVVSGGTTDSANVLFFGNLIMG